MLGVPCSSTRGSEPWTPLDGPEPAGGRVGSVGTGPLRLSCRIGRVPLVTSDDTDHLSPAGADDPDAIEGVQAALAEARERLGEVPASVVVTNHVMGLYELAAIHLSAQPARLQDAVLAIDAMGCLVEGLGDRLGEEAALMRDALANIRLAFVQIKGAG